MKRKIAVKLRKNEQTNKKFIVYILIYKLFFLLFFLSHVIANLNSVEDMEIIM